MKLAFRRTSFEIGAGNCSINFTGTLKEKQNFKTNTNVHTAKKVREGEDSSKVNLILIPPLILEKARNWLNYFEWRRR